MYHLFKCLVFLDIKCSDISKDTKPLTNTYQFEMDTENYIKLTNLDLIYKTPKVSNIIIYTNYYYGYI